MREPRIGQASPQLDDPLLLLNTLLATSQVGFAILDSERHYVRVNQALAAINGSPPGAHIDSRLRVLLPELAPELEPLLRATLERGEPMIDISVSGDTPAAPGERRHWLSNYCPVRAERGRVLGIIVVADVTERKRAEGERARLDARLAAERELLEAVLQQMPAVVIIAEPPSGRLILGNEQVEMIWRRPFRGVANSELYDQYPAFRADGRPYRPEERPLARTVSTGEVVADEEMDILRGDGTRGTIRGGSAPIRDRDGRIVAAVATFQDVTERKRARQAQRLLAEASMLVTASLGYPPLPVWRACLCPTSPTGAPST